MVKGCGRSARGWRGGWVLIGGRRGFSEGEFDGAVGHGDFGGFLEGAGVFALEGVAGVGGGEEVAGLGEEGLADGGVDGLVGGEPFIDGDDELGHGAEPGEEGIGEEELEQFASAAQRCVGALVALALVLDEDLVDLEEAGVGPGEVAVEGARGGDDGGIGHGAAPGQSVVLECRRRVGVSARGWRNFLCLPKGERW